MVPHGTKLMTNQMTYISGHGAAGAGVLCSLMGTMEWGERAHDVNCNRDALDIFGNRLYTTD